MIVLLMGVSGSGKTTTGEALAAALGWRFFDGDDFHPAANVAKMAAGTPLTDDDRWPWLDSIAMEMRNILASDGAAVFACSALKADYRSRLQSAGDVRLVHLNGDAATIGARLARRAHRYMPASLLSSQFATLETPLDAVVIDIREPVPTQIQRICDALALRQEKTKDVPGRS
ncbi:MAG: gluconokinase [Betaproteobacteria bacterium]